MRVLLALAAVLVTGPDVNKLVLQPAQVGDGYVMVQRRDGVGVNNTVTMNLCGTAGYPSERLRTARFQVDYLKPSAVLGLSNEVVAYKKGGAAQAMREALQHAAQCPTKAIKTDPSLPPLRFSFERVKAAKLLPGYLAFRVRVTGTVKGKKVDQTSYAVYQRKGDLLSGTYSFGPNTKAQLQFVLHAAQQSAINLRRGKAVSGPTA
ncbi:MAG TPA: hypothetical protein VFA56_10615 [Gaiellaceae bacterium]|nr:hypothetical protein [Gaiellaceae bacterium]